MLKTALALTCLTLSVSANAALVGRLETAPGSGVYQAYYDDVADVTWLTDANYAKTSGYDADGVMGWVDANAWAAGLNIDGVTGWRLPDTPQPDSSCSQQGGGGAWGGSGNCTGSEMGNLFYNVLGGTSGAPLAISNNGNLALFDNVRPKYYWSATDGSVFGVTDEGWIFDFDVGHQGCCNGGSFAWAVQSGDVGETSIPESSTLKIIRALAQDKAAE